MKKHAALIALSIQTTIIAWWFSNIRYEQGVDAILYHHMAAAINRFGYAPWIVNPLSYMGIYPGSDSSAVPFLAASFSALSGLPLPGTILLYDLLLLVLFGIGLFTLVNVITHRLDASLFALLLGGTSYGFFATTLWSLDERSFNVALAPTLLYLAISVTASKGGGRFKIELLLLAVSAFVMYAGHLSVLLLLPVLVILPLVYNLARRQLAFRRTRLSSFTLVAATVGVPLVAVFAMTVTGVSSSLGLQFSLEQSALFEGNSAPAYALNSVVFISTRAGPIVVSLAGLGLLYLGTRRLLADQTVLIAGMLLGGLVGLPIITYSKDLVTVVLVLPAAIAAPYLLKTVRPKALIAVAIAGAMALSGAIAFDSWNLDRSTAASTTRYWTSPGLTMEPVAGNLWVSANSDGPVCVYGNNWLATRLVATNPYEFLCGDSSVEYLVEAVATAQTRSPIDFQFVGVNGPNPNSWFQSANLTQVTSDFSRLPSMDYRTGVALLRHYGVRYIVVSLAKPSQTPGFEYEGSANSRFFAELWTNQYPLYRTSQFAIFSG